MGTKIILYWTAHINPSFLLLHWASETSNLSSLVSYLLTVQISAQNTYPEQKSLLMLSIPARPVILYPVTLQYCLHGTNPF